MKHDLEHHEPRMIIGDAPADGPPVPAGDTRDDIVSRPIDTRRVRLLSLTVEWDAQEGTDGDWRLEQTDDPRFIQDIETGDDTAVWVERTIPDGCLDGENFTVDGKSITIDETAGFFQMCLTDLSAGTRLKYVQRDGGGQTSAQAFASAKE